IAARNCLGTINQSLLTCWKLQEIAETMASRNPRTSRPIQKTDIRIVLMAEKNPDASATSNLGILRELVRVSSVLSIPFLGKKACFPKGLALSAKKMKKTLAQILN